MSAYQTTRATRQSENRNPSPHSAHPAPSLSRRSFVAGATLAAAGALLGAPKFLPPASSRCAYADQNAQPLDYYIVRMRPKGFLRTVGVHDDGRDIGDVCWLWNQGTSSKHLLAWEPDLGGYSIHTLSNFEENESATNSVWSVDGDSKDEGKAIHVWGSKADGKKSRAFTFERTSGGTYLIKNVNSGRYLTLETPSSDKDQNKIVQSSTSMEWELEIVGYNTDGKSYPSSSFYATYASATTGANWMSLVPDNVLLSNLSIPGTHDTGTCSVDNDSEPQSSMAKCQQDYIPTQLNEGIRYFDIRLGEGSDPGLHHGGAYLKRKNGSGLQLSHVMSYFETFLADQPSEAIIMLATGSDEDAEAITNALGGYIEAKPEMFWGAEYAPTMAQARGKIVLLRRFTPKGTHAGTHQFGIDLTGWDDAIQQGLDKGEKSLVKIFDKQVSDTAGNAMHTRVFAQDNYSALPDDKIAYVDNALKDAEAHCDPSDASSTNLIINYTSSSQFFGIQSNPYYAAQKTNAHLYENSYINWNGNAQNANCNAFVGVVVSDFTDASLARSIYRRNYEQANNTAMFYLPTAARLTYGESLMNARFEGGKTLGDGYYMLADRNAVLNVASSGTPFTLMYVHVNVDGIEQDTDLVGSVPFTIDPRTVTVDWSEVEAATTNADTKAALRGALKGVLEGDECYATYELYHDRNGAQGEQVADGENFGAGSYWVRVTGLAGAHAENYRLSEETKPGKFTVKESETATTDEKQQTTPEPSGKNNVKASEHPSFAATGDDAFAMPVVGIAAAAAVAAGVAQAALRNDA